MEGKKYVEEVRVIDDVIGDKVVIKVELEVKFKKLIVEKYCFV